MRKDKTKPTGIARTLREERKREQEKAIRLLEKMKAFEARHTMYRHVFPNGMIISSSKKKNIEDMKDVLCVNK